MKFGVTVVPSVSDWKLFVDLETMGYDCAWAADSQMLYSDAYAVLALKVRNIVVMGHAQCGGIGAAIDPSAAHGVPYVNEWVELAKPAVEAAHGQAHGHGLDKNQATEREAVKLSVRRLLAYPFIAERVKFGELAVDGMRFNIATGVLELLDQKTGHFTPVKTRRSWFW